MALTLEMVIEELSNTCMELDIPFDHISDRIIIPFVIGFEV